MREPRQPWWVLPVMLGLLLLPSVSARAQDCGVYRADGVRLGMTSRDVRKAMDGPAEQVERSATGTSRYVTEKFLRSSSELEVTFDEGAESDPKRAKSVRVRFVLPRGGEPAVLSRYGDPDAGAEALVDGRAEGPVVWLDPACGVVVTADRETKDWWEGGDHRTVVEFQTWKEGRERAGTPAAEAIAAWESAPSESWQAVLSLQPTAVAGAAPPVAQAPREPPSPQAPPGAYVPPARLEESYVAPVYPRFPRGPRVPGEVVLEVTVLPDGTVGAVDVQSVSPPGRGFEVAAQSAVRRWTYRPAMLDGKPTEAKINVEIRFE
jgi:TonB family protein